MADVSVPSTPPLGNLRRVELIHTGEWPISTGRWRASREDLAAAVAALDCPAVRRPILKLGHSHDEEPLWAGNPTGAPAVGWVDNMHLVNEGHTLVGDFVGMPGWLANIAASAYPDRSVEGTYDYRCALGHTHPFVITAVALLGVTPPGVGTLKSLQDVARLYGVDTGGGGEVAASAAGEPVEAAAQVHTGAMVALIPSEEDIRRLVVDDGEPAEQLHTTLLFLGKADMFGPEARRALLDAVAELAKVIPPGEADGFAIAAFNPDKADMDTAIVLEVGGEGLEDVHGMVQAAVDEVIEAAGITIPEQHAPWRPHITLVYSDDLSRVVELADRTGPVRYDRLRVAFGPDVVDFPLAGEPADELDVDALTDGDMPDPDTVDAEAAGEVEAARSQTRRVTRSDAPLRRYWLRGKGALKIRWNTPGDWTRCVRHLRKYVRDPKGLCAVYHRQATGMWPGDRRNRRHAAAPVVAHLRGRHNQETHGRWADMHPATPDEIAAFRKRFGKAIPPAWRDVHIADDLDNASLLVRGIDSKGRPQSIYSAAHTEAQAAKKFARVKALNGHLDKLDFALERDAATNDDAAALLLIRRLGMRPGSTKDTRAAQKAYGATTLLARHVTVKDGRATFDFIGKKGVHIRVSSDDPVVVDAVSRRLATRSGDDRLFDTTAERVRDYMHSTGVPGEFKLKDLRTLHANVIALREIEAHKEPPRTKREFQRARMEVARAVSAALGNTPTVALASYINPTVFGAWAKDPDWVAAAAPVSRDEEKRLLAAWFAAVTWDRPETGIPPVEPDPDDPDEEDEPPASVAAHAPVARLVLAHLRGRHNQKSHGNRYGPDGRPIPGKGMFRDGAASVTRRRAPRLVAEGRLIRKALNPSLRSQIDGFMEAFTAAELRQRRTGEVRLDQDKDLARQHQWAKRLGLVETRVDVEPGQRLESGRWLAKLTDRGRAYRAAFEADEPESPRLRKVREDLAAADEWTSVLRQLKERSDRGLGKADADGAARRAVEQVSRELGLPGPRVVDRMRRSSDAQERARGEAAREVLDAAEELARRRVELDRMRAQTAMVEQLLTERGDLRSSTADRLRRLLAEGGRRTQQARDAVTEAQQRLNAARQAWQQGGRPAGTGRARPVRRVDLNTLTEMVSTLVRLGGELGRSPDTRRLANSLSDLAFAMRRREGAVSPEEAVKRLRRMLDRPAAQDDDVRSMLTDAIDRLQGLIENPLTFPGDPRLGWQPRTRTARQGG